MNYFKNREYFNYLIELVREYPCLYDKTTSVTTSKSRIQKIWTEIAGKCGKSVEECKKRWNLLRKTYTHKIRVRSRIPDLREIHEDWEYFYTLTFLNDHINLRKSKDLPMETNANSTEAPVEETPEPVNKSYTESKNSFETLHTLLDCKNGFNHTSSKFNNTLRQLRIHKSKRPYSDEPTEDEIFVKNIVVLMKALPEEIQSNVKGEIYAHIYKLRAENRQIVVKDENNMEICEPNS